MLSLSKIDIFPVATPLPDLPGVKALPQDETPAVLMNFVSDTADRISCPSDFVAIAAITALSAIIGRKRTIKGKLFDNWIVTPNLWGMLIGPPSSMKSPALKAALSPLDDIEVQLAASYSDAIRDFELEDRLQKMQAANQDRSVKNALKAKGMDAARAMLADYQCENKEAPVRQRLVVNDSTIEKMQELIAENQNGLLVVRDELGGFISKLESEDFAEHRSFLLVAHHGQSRFVIDRIGRGTIVLPHVCVSILGGVQPARVDRLVRGAMSGNSDDGLLQRFQLTVWPDKQREWKWKDREACADAKNEYASLFNALYEMEHSDEPIQLSESAYKIFKMWHVTMRHYVDSENVAPAMAAHLLKSAEAVLSLALIFQLCTDVNSQLISASAMSMAVAWADYLKSHAQRLYHSKNMSEISAAQRIIKSREDLPSAFTPRDVYRKNWAGIDRECVLSAILLLLDFGHLHEVVEQTAGRPSKLYQWTY